MKNHYDLICLGGGSGGLAAARRAAEHDARVLVIEPRALGGTCVNVGCVPKKIAWHAAQIKEFIKLGHEYGISSGTVSFDYGTFAKKRDAFIHKLNGIYANSLKNANITVVEGYAQFVDNHTVAVGDDTYSAEHIIIAVGGEPMMPNIPGAELGIDSDDFFALQELPRSIAISGSGYIAVEIAGLLNALGVDTHLLVRKERFLRQVDESIYEVLLAQMQADGITIHTNTEVESVVDSVDGLSLLLSTGSNLAVDTLLWAIGRTPMTDVLGLQNTGVEMAENGMIRVDAQQNTTCRGVYAIGDITGQPTLTPAAIEAGRQLSERLFNQVSSAQADFTFVPTVIFSHPAIGTVGLTEQEAVECYGREEVNVYQSTFNPLLRSMTEHKVPTRMKMVCVGEQQKVLGLHVIGDFADEVIQGFAVAVQMGATKQDFDNTLAIHPTSGEEFVTMK